MSVVTDDFNRSNEELGTSANWTEDAGDWEVSSNQAIQATAAGVYYKARWAGAPLAGDDGYCQAAIDTTTSAANEGTGVGYRLTSDANASGYTAIAFEDDAYYLLDMAAGVENVLGSWGTPANSAVTLRVEAESTTIRLKVDGTERVSVSDSSYSSGPPGMFSYADAGVWDNWEAGDIAAAGGQPMHLRALAVPHMRQWQPRPFS